MRIMNTLRWLRVVGDTIFAVGILVLGWFVLGLKTGWSISTEGDPGVPVSEEQARETVTV